MRMEGLHFADPEYQASWMAWTPSRHDPDRERMAERREEIGKEVKIPVGQAWGSSDLSL